MTPGPRLKLWRTARDLSIAESARVLRLSRAHTYRLVQSGELPTHTDALGRRRVAPADLARIIDAQPGLLNDEGA